MSYCECSLCGEPLTAPQFYKGAPYGSSCIQKAIAMDVPNAGTGKRKPKPKATGDIYLTFKVDSVETISTEGKGTIHVRSSEWGKGYFDLKNWWGDGFCTLNKAVRYDADKGIIIVNFGNGSYNLREKRDNWKWNENVLKRHNIIIWDQSKRDGLGAWVENKNPGASAPLV